MSDDMMTVTAPRHSRRLSDKILIAFHLACDQGDLTVARRLLEAVETAITVSRFASALPGSRRRRDQEALIAAHERLWKLRHPDVEVVATFPRATGYVMPAIAPAALQ
jgi:hypothetical protein